MQRRTLILTAFAVIAATVGCNHTEKSKASLVDILNTTQTISLKTLSDTDYPDNPDKSIESSLMGTYAHNKLILKPQGEFKYNFILLPGNKESDTIFVNNVNVAEWIPTTPTGIDDEFIKKICLVNYEFNRQQIKFTDANYQLKGNGNEDEIIGRIDIARNCLMTGLWEIIAYDKEGKPYYHSWFDFPKDLFGALFDTINTTTKYADVKHYLESWEDIAGQPIDLRVIRGTPKNVSEAVFTNLNNEMYPLVGERKKKFINVIYPTNPTSINDFLTDSTVFATFSPPGFYSKAEPKKTQLSKLARLNNISVRAFEKTIEIDAAFLAKNNDSITRLVIGGFSLNEIPTLAAENCNDGYQMPMGLGNHSFYEFYDEYLQTAKTRDGYYGLFLDKNNVWIDSHTLGIDGPLLHFDDKEPNKLHLWILSFERHALVGHYIITLPATLLNK